MSDPTRIRSTSLLTTLPVPANSALAPRTHAPTLVGGQGDPDSVRVWAPDPKEFQRQGAFWGAMGKLWPVCGAGLVAWMCLMPTLLRLCPLVFVLAPIVLMMVAMISDVAAKRSRARRRPCYLSTDESGIGVTTMAGSACFRWEQIIGVGFDPTLMNLTLKLANGEVRKLYLLGYSEEQIDALLPLITEASDMLPDAMQGEGKWYHRAGFPDGVGMSVVRLGQRPLDYNWDAPALPQDGGDLTPAEKDAGVETLRIGHRRVTMYSICWLVGTLGSWALALCTGQLLWGLMVMPLSVVLTPLILSTNYCSTNKSGIRAQSQSGPCALRWEDVTCLERRRFRLMLGSSEPMYVTTFGCKRADVDALVGRIVERAQLVPDLERENRWVRRPECEALAGTRVMLSGTHS